MQVRDGKKVGNYRQSIMKPKATGKRETMMEIVT
jgi:hypothetical protein